MNVCVATIKIEIRVSENHIERPQRITSIFLHSLVQPTLSLGVCLWTAPITRALITNRWSPVMVRSGCVPDHCSRGTNPRYKYTCTKLEGAE